jgi:hypothetical protein
MEFEEKKEKFEGNNEKLAGKTQGIFYSGGSAFKKSY